MFRKSTQRFALLLSAFALLSPAEDLKPVSVFDGKTLEGWNVNKGEEKYWTVRDEMIVGGSLTQRIPHNTFLATDKRYENFEMEFDIRLVQGTGFANSGIQVRSIRVPNKHEMSGYQADAGIKWWGKLYDESRRNKVIADSVDPAAIAKTAKDWDWNHHRIRCEGKRIRSWINGVPALDFTEKEPKISQEGLIGLQAHGGGTFEVQFKNVTIVEFPATPGALTWESLKKESRQEKK